MPSRSLRERFFTLPSYRKLIFSGSVLAILSIFFPWYSDLDSHNIGDTFLGITGPLSLIGVLVLLGGVISFVWTLAYMYGKRLPHVPVREAIMHMTIGIESLLFIVVAASVYFHPKFGLNIISKEPRFGILLTAIGMVLVIVGGYYQNQTEGQEESEQEDFAHPLAEMPRNRPPIARTIEDVREVPTESEEEVSVGDESGDGKESGSPSLGL